MSLEKIGFYTLSDERARESSPASNMKRCEMILTDNCNFKCPYCRGIREDFNGTMSLEDAKKVVKYWADDGLENIRFTGGEPTVYPQLLELIKYTKEQGVKRIAISTNGSAPMNYYYKLIDAGVNDMSISLDACCSADGEIMAGGIPGVWERVVDNIKKISKVCYVTLGMVFVEETMGTVNDVVRFGSELGVADIRVITAAQYNQTMTHLINIDQDLLNKHPILAYRVKNFKANRNVRGLQEGDSHRCGIMMDDSAVVGDSHFPCIIYLREGGDPVGKVGPNMRQERIDWINSHDTHEDPICKNNCLDVCIDYNNKWDTYHDIEKFRELYNETVTKLSFDSVFGILTRSGLELKMQNIGIFNAVFIDFEHIKEMNEKYGYEEVNKRIREKLDKLKYPDYILGRWFSGEEQVIISVEDFTIPFV